MSRRLFTLAALLVALAGLACGCHRQRDVTADPGYLGDWVPGATYELRRDVELIDGRGLTRLVSARFHGGGVGADGP